MIREWAGGNLLLELALSAAIIGLAIMPAFNLVPIYCIWWERKVAGRIQSRMGPTHVGGWHGWAQSFADGIKLLFKEDLIPAGADKFLFRFATYLAVVPVFTAFVVIPWSPQFVFESTLHIGVLYLLAFLALEAIAVIVAGWGSNSKWAVYGAMREACQMVSYEIPMGLSIIIGVLVAGTLNLVELGYLQGAGVWDWFIHHNPFMFIAFFVYFISSLASNKRAPFDLPESESELVAGFHTEYSGLRWSMFFFAEYNAMFLVGAIQVALFLGGWNSPLGVYDPVYRLIGYDPIHAGQQYFSGAISAATTWTGKAEAMGISPIGLLILNVYCVKWFVFKTLTIVFIQIWLRWTLPRVRIDQVMYGCVKVLLPASLLLLVFAAVWMWLVPQMPGVLAGGKTVAYLGHLAWPQDKLDVPLQAVTQVVLTLASVALVGSMIGVVLWAWLNRGQQPRKTLFSDVMPVSRDVAFTAKFPEGN